MASAALLFKAAEVKASFSCGHTDITCATPHPLAFGALPRPLFEGSGLGRFHSEYRVGSGLRRFSPRAKISRGRAKSAEISNGDDRRTKFTRNATDDKGESEEGRRGVRAEQDDVPEEKPKRRRASPRAKKMEEAKAGVPQAEQVKKEAQALKSTIKRVEKEIKDVEKEIKDVENKIETAAKAGESTEFLQ
jgi:predicted  nucleic acid-binding Zn-ribbon protein